MSSRPKVLTLVSNDDKARERMLKRLDEVAERVRAGKVKTLCILLDQGFAGGEYSHHTIAAGVRTCEIVGLLAIAQHELIADMNAG
jgi:hypothetical protein